MGALGRLMSKQFSGARVLRGSSGLEEAEAISSGVTSNC